ARGSGGPLKGASKINVAHEIETSKHGFLSNGWVE
ncbi:MAG: hypothetical protein ACI9R8_001283, partial [Candidatus Paceibacteria bacterium]